MKSTVSDLRLKGNESNSEFEMRQCGGAWFDA